MQLPNVHCTLPAPLQVEQRPCLQSLQLSLYAIGSPFPSRQPLDVAVRRKLAPAYRCPQSDNRPTSNACASLGELLYCLFNRVRHFVGGVGGADEGCLAVRTGFDGIEAALNQTTTENPWEALPAEFS